MPTPLRRRLRLARRGLGYTIAVAVVLVAVLLGIASQLLPLAERNPGQIAGWLSERAGRTVAFDRVDTQWTRRGPLLQLDNLRIGDGAGAFTVGDAEVLVSVYAGLLPGRAFSELRLRGLDLTLERAADGRWQVRGLPGQQQSGEDPLEALEGLGELQVIDGKLAVIAPSLGIDARIPRIDLRVRVDGERVLAGVRAWPQLDAMPLDAVLELDRASGDGRAYGGARRADLSAWSPLLRVAGVAVGSGRGRAEAWAGLRGHRLARVTLEAALDDVGLHGTATPEDGRAASQAQLGRVEGRAHWVMGADGWRLDAPVLRVRAAGHLQTLDGLVLTGGRRHTLRAERIDVAPLLAVASLSDRVPPAWRRWLQATQPQATMHEVEIHSEHGGPMHASARISGLGFDAVGDAAGVQGLAGALDSDADGFSLQLDPASPLRLDWPGGFGAERSMRLAGNVSGWREGGGWRIGTAGLRIEAADAVGTGSGGTGGRGSGDGVLGLEARGSLWWQGDGTRPWLELAAAFDEFQLPLATDFLVRHRMSESVAAWLDAALLGGSLQDGRALVSGDLDHWPFSAGEGRFEASAHINQGELKFHPEWPAAEAVEADVRFVGDGFELAGTGALAGIDIGSLRAGIDAYRGGRLRVQARGSGDASRLLSLLRDSPLHSSHADTLDNLSARGAAALGFELVLPLRRGSRPRIAGSIELANAELADARWQLGFDRVSGRAEYSRSGFRAEKLRVRHEGAPGRLSLRAGKDYVEVPGQAFEAELDVAIAADRLLERAPQLAWLQPHLEGRSAWNIAVAVHASRPRGWPAARLRLRSDLVGTGLALPAPLRKPAAEALAATVEAPL
ncbi:MAG: hypothetical protein KY442_04195, partial [Proteobacteria bacterium]|nr:hypothetical protein [Pseudomonadota bacterium]